MMVSRIQEHLEAIYGIRCEVRVSAFLVDDEDARRLGATGRTEEELLLSEHEGELEVALYLSSPLLARLTGLEDCSAKALFDEALPAYCQVAEGVSHFVYLSHTAAEDRRVSLLELEAQALELFGRLFDRVGYNPALRPDERWRYEQANRLSRAYCKRLLPHVANRRLDRLLSELRYSYRLGADAKLRYLYGAP